MELKKLQPALATGKIVCQCTVSGRLDCAKTKRELKQQTAEGLSYSSSSLRQSEVGRKNLCLRLQASPEFASFCAHDSMAADATSLKAVFI